MSDTGRLVRYTVGGFAALALGTLALRALNQQSQRADDEEPEPEAADPVAAEEEAFTGDTGSAGEALEETVGYIGGSIAAGAIPGVGAGALVNTVAETVNDRWATDGTTRLLEEKAGRERYDQMLQDYLKRQEGYDKADRDINKAVDDIFDLAPLPDDAPPVLRGLRDGVRDTFADAITAPVEGIQLIDSGVTAIGFFLSPLSSFFFFFFFFFSLYTPSPDAYSWQDSRQSTAGLGD